MRYVVRGMENFAKAYLDDLVLISDTWSEHLNHLQTVLERLQEFSLTAKMAKCQWAMGEYTYIPWERDWWGPC